MTYSTKKLVVLFKIFEAKTTENNLCVLDIEKICSQL